MSDRRVVEFGPKLAVAERERVVNAGLVADLRKLADEAEAGDFAAACLVALDRNGCVVTYRNMAVSERFAMIGATVVLRDMILADVKG